MNRRPRPGKPLPFRHTTGGARPNRRKYPAKTGCTLAEFVRAWCSQGVDKIKLAQDGRAFA